MPSEKTSVTESKGNPAGLSGASDTMMRSRFECKYLIHPRMVEAIRAYMRPYVQLDRHARAQPGHRYPICSLYLDSPDLKLCEATERGDKNRFKLRIRSYGDGPEQQVFLEVKKRMDGIVYKLRCTRSQQQFQAFCQTLLSGKSQAPRNVSVELEEFSQLLFLHKAGPVMRLKYQREAYETVAKDPVRITFDTDLVSTPTFDYYLSHSGSDWVPTPLGGTVLEIKFTERFPPWVGEMIKRFDLRRCSVAKYVLSMKKALAEGRCRRPISRFGQASSDSA